MNSHNFEHGDWIGKWANYLPGKIAVKEAENQRSISFSDLHKLSLHIASYLINNFHLKKSDRIALLTENCIENIILFSCAQKFGFCLVPLNYRLSSAEISGVLSDCEPSLVIYENKFKYLLEKWKSSEPTVKQVEIDDLLQEPNMYIDLTPESLSVHDPAFILYTSGSTGNPKGVIYTHAMMFWNSINTALSISISSETRTVNCMPPFHTGGWNVLTTPLLHFGGYTCLVKRFDPAFILQLLQSERPDVFMAVPTMLKMIADQPDFVNADLSSITYILVGGEPMPIPLIEKWHEKGVKIRQGFGMTEVGPNLTSLHHEYAISKKGSIGKPNFYLDVRIVDESDNDVKVGQAGELVFRGPVVTPGYWKNESATREVFKNGWFHTGDMARMDDEGFLYIVDRIKNMYISGGENVYPAEIEKILLKHTSISEAVVVARKHEKWGETGIAFVVLKPNHSISEQDILDYCKENLAKFKVPSDVYFKDTLPKTDSGKIDRKWIKNNLL